MLNQAQSCIWKRGCLFSCKFYKNLPNTNRQTTSLIYEAFYKVFSQLEQITVQNKK